MGLQRLKQQAQSCVNLYNVLWIYAMAVSVLLLWDCEQWEQVCL